MKITDIKQQVKRSDRYSIYIDDKYAFSLSADELLHTGLHPNQELSKSELEKLKADALLDKAYDRALNLIVRRPRSEWELRDYLKRKEYDAVVSGQVIVKLRDRGYVNDTDFAERWVANRRLLKATSKRRLALELRQKHVAADIIDQVLQADETDELEVLKDLVEKKRKQSKYQDSLKLMQYLSRQGFSYDLIKQALAATED
jgi:regulatory protein